MRNPSQVTDVSHVALDITGLLHITDNFVLRTTLPHVRIRPVSSNCQNTMCNCHQGHL